MPRASCSLCHRRWEGEDIKMFHVPTCSEKRLAWTKACGIGLSKNSRVCSKHFREKDFNSRTQNGNARRRALLKESAVPSVLLLQKGAPSDIDSYSLQAKPHSSKAIVRAMPSQCTHELAQSSRELNVSESVSSQKQNISEQQSTKLLVHSSNSVLQALPSHCAHELDLSSRVLTVDESFHPQNKDISDQLNLANIQMHPLDQMEVLEQLEAPSFPLVFSALTNYDCNLYQNIQTQTEPEVVEAGIILENLRLKNLVQKLTSENKILNREKLELQEQLSGLSIGIQSIFTEGQIRKLTFPNKRLRWSSEDMSCAISLHAAGPRAYNHLYRKGFPLPCTRTITNWLQKVEFEDGIINFIFELMKNTHELSDEEKLCVLAFDEMKIASKYEHDPSQDLIRKPSNYVQVVIARGLKGSWKQPVFFAYDCKMTTTLLTEIVVKLREASFPVVAIVSDMGPTNQALWRDLGVSTDKSWFQNPAAEDEKIFVFADAPHLLKLIRNHFLDTGIIYEGKIITPGTIKTVMELCSKSDVSITFKVTEEHLTAHHAGRQKVKLAAQVFSNSIANAIRRCYSLGEDVNNALETADFIQLINDWFDILNSKLSTANSIPTKKPFGKDLVIQSEVLRKMSCLMNEPIIPNKKTLAPFQKGVIITNASLIGLHEYLKARYNMEYIITYRLNQDLVENFFSAMRSKGGLHDHPSPMEFKYRLRKYLIGT